MASSDLKLQRGGAREGLHAPRACVVCVCVFLEGGGVDAGEDEREKRSAQCICSLNFTAHYLVTLRVSLPSILYFLSRV